MFYFFVLLYYLYIELGQIPRHIYRYMDIEIGGGADSGGADGADGAEAVGMIGLTTTKNK